MKSCIAGLFICFVMIICVDYFSKAYADVLEDEMNQMDEDRGGQRFGNTRASRAGQAIYSGVAGMVNSLSSYFSSVHTAPAEDENDLDFPPERASNGGSVWQSIQKNYDTVRNTIRDFPFPHWTSAPGIVGDYTAKLCDQIDRVAANE